MPRDGSGVYSKPAGTTASPDTTIESSKYNAFADDIVVDLNAARPVTAGGTGATNVAAARTALGAVALADVKWLSKAIGEIFAIYGVTGVDVPPNDNPAYRFIRLSANSTYNAGALTSESVSGSSPLVVATAVIDDDDSPLDGRTIHLINTERRFLRGGLPGDVQADAMQQLTGTITRVMGPTSSSGAFTQTSVDTLNRGSSPQTATVDIAFDSANSPGARTDNETRPKNIGVNYYMRIR